MMMLAIQVLLVLVMFVGFMYAMIGEPPAPTSRVKFFAAPRSRSRKMNLKPVSAEDATGDPNEAQNPESTEQNPISFG
jgi:hypothetical protein